MNNIKIEYFIDYWQDIVTPRNSIEDTLIHEMLYNPKEFLKEFLYELKIKGLSNSDNKKLFLDKVNEFSNFRLKTINFILPTLRLIQKQMYKKDDNGYLKHLIGIAITKLADFKLGKEAVIELAEELTNKSNINKNKIKRLVNIITIELKQKKFSQKTVLKIITNIFSDCQELKNGIKYSNFPHDFKHQDTNNKSDKNKYNEKLKKYIEGLSYKDRILALSNYFDQKSRSLRFIFSLKGLKGKNTNIKFGNVQIYNPKFIQLFIKPPKYINECFDSNHKENNLYCNGAVLIDTIDVDYAQQEALQILENTLDIISIRYIRYNVALRLNKSTYYIIDNKGAFNGNGSVNAYSRFDYKDSIEIKNEEYREINNFLSNNQTSIDKRILESVHWKRKAIEAVENNEKILWHWVALENLIDNPKKIFEIISKIFAKKQLYDFAWQHYLKLDILTSRWMLLSKDKIPVQLPNELKDKLGLNALKKIHLKILVNNLSEIEKHVKEGSLFHDQIKYLNTIFSDSKNSIQLLELFEKIIYEKLVYVYRLRNKIVHNADNEQNPLISIYVDFITEVTAIIIKEFIFKRNKHKLNSSEEIRNNILYDFDKFKIELKDIGTEILLV